MAELKLFPGFDLPGAFSFCDLSFEKRLLLTLTFQVDLSDLFESQTLGMVDQKHSEIKIAKSFDALMYQEEKWEKGTTQLGLKQPQNYHF